MSILQFASALGLAGLLAAAWPLYRGYRAAKVRHWAKTQGWQYQGGRMYTPHWFFVRHTEAGCAWELTSVHRQAIARETISFTEWHSNLPNPLPGIVFCGPRPPQTLPAGGIEFGGMLIQIALRLMVDKKLAEALSQAYELPIGNESFQHQFMVCGASTTALAQRLISPQTQALLAAWPSTCNPPVITYHDGQLRIRLNIHLIHPHQLRLITDLGQTLLRDWMAHGDN